MRWGWNSLPARHGKVRKQDFAIRCLASEKQKLIFHYGIREKQLHWFVRTVKPLGLRIR